jgi:hypothetical protein
MNKNLQFVALVAAGVLVALAVRKNVAAVRNFTE